MNRLHRALLGFVAAVAVVALFLAVVGWRSVVAELARTDPAVFALGFLGVVAGLACWTESLRQLIGASGSRVGGVRYRLAYLSGEFAKQVIPMGQSGGPVLLSWAVSSQTDAAHEDTMAAATVFTFVNIAASLVVATLGLGAYLAGRRGAMEPVLVTMLGGLVFGVVSLAVVVVLFVRRRSVVERGLGRFVGAIRRPAGRLSARAHGALDPERARASFRAYSTVFDVVLANRRQVGRASVAAVAGWLLFLVPMYTSFRALGEPISYPLVLFVIPVVIIVNVVPLPGGLGGFEVAAAGVFAALTGADLPTATAGVFLFRLSNYWFVVLLGGLASAYLSISIRDPPGLVMPAD